jgi:hypothetical protein
MRHITHTTPQCDFLAEALGLSKVGWIFSQATTDKEQEYILSSSEVGVGVELHPCLLRAWVWCCCWLWAVCRRLRCSPPAPEHSSLLTLHHSSSNTTKQTNTTKQPQIQQMAAMQDELGPKSVTALVTWVDGQVHFEVRVGAC